MEKEIILELRDIKKSFGEVEVLHGINMSLHKGKILGLVGENGAGKSTLMNVLGGVYQKFGGEMLLNGEAYAPKNPLDATAKGVAFIHQELNLFTNLTIAENLFIDEGVEHKRLMRAKEINTKAAKILERLGIRENTKKTVGELTMGMRQMVEIAKAVSKKAKIIIFDEPTTSLSTVEKENLFRQIRAFSAEGIAMIYISHALDDVFELCDEIQVIRDGAAIGGQEPASSMTKAELIRRMVGREMGQVYPYVEKQVGDMLLELKNVSEEGVLKDVSLKIFRGEIVGLLGLMGAGRTELAKAVYGVDKITGGEIWYKGMRVTRNTPGFWVKNGVAYITEDRRGEGLLLPESVSDNLALVNLPSIQGRLASVNTRKQQKNTNEMIELMHIKCGKWGGQPVGQLSGGNQQKVVIGKWLLIAPDLLILDEPTRGIDVGAKYDIYSHINQKALEGTGVLFISSEMDELMGVCDRILVMSAGKITGEVRREDYAADLLMRYAIGDGEI